PLYIRRLHARALAASRLALDPQAAHLGQRARPSLEDGSLAFAQPVNNVALERVHFQPVARFQDPMTPSRRAAVVIRFPPNLQSPFQDTINLNYRRSVD